MDASGGVSQQRSRGGTGCSCRFPSPPACATSKHPLLEGPQKSLTFAALLERERLAAAVPVVLLARDALRPRVTTPADSPLAVAPLRGIVSALGLE